MVLLKRPILKLLLAVTATASSDLQSYQLNYNLKHLFGFPVPGTAVQHVSHKQHINCRCTFRQLSHRTRTTCPSYMEEHNYDTNIAFSQARRGTMRTFVDDYFLSVCLTLTLTALYQPWYDLLFVLSVFLFFSPTFSALLSFLFHAYYQTVVVNPHLLTLLS